MHGNKMHIPQTPYTTAHIIPLSGSRGLAVIRTPIIAWRRVSSSRLSRVSSFLSFLEILILRVADTVFVDGEETVALRKTRAVVDLAHSRLSTSLA